MTEKVRPNFFVILGLNPDATWDQAAFERALAAGRGLWSRQRSGIKTHPVTVEARRNLALLPELERVMRDPRLRRAEQEAARRERAAAMQQRRDRFREQVDLLLEKGFIYDVELEALETETDLLSGDPAVRARLEKATKRSFRQAREDDERLESAIERTLRANLAVLRDADLYEALRRVDPNITEMSPRKQLLAAADALYRKAINTMDKRKPEVSAMQELAGLARRIFNSDELVRRHNLSMRLAPLEALLTQYEKDLSATRTVDARQVQRFMRRAAELKVDLEQARYLLVSYFRERNWSVELPGPAVEAEIKRLVSCPQCDRLNEADVEFCVSCGGRLQERCPRCDGVVMAASRACGRCGFLTGERDWVGYLADKAESSLDRQNEAEARVDLARARQLWPLGPGSPDKLARRLYALQQRIDQMDAARREARGKIDGLMRARRYHEALGELGRLPFGVPHASQLQADAQARIREAESLCQQACTTGASEEQRAARYVAALRLCADHEEARLELARIPPPAPTGLRVIPHPDRGFVHLTWTYPVSADVTFVVVRSDSNEPPFSTTAVPGQSREAGLTETQWNDVHPRIGSPMRYAVYAERLGTMSVRGSVAADRVFMTPDPRLRRVQPGDNQVELWWSLPENASGVEVLRDEEPSTAGPIAIPPTEPGMLLDRQVRNHVRYQYTVRAVYRDPAPGDTGRVRLSAGVLCETTPGPPPEPPTHLYVQGRTSPAGMSFYRHRVELRWPQPRHGVIKVIRAVEQPVLRYGDELAEHDLDRYGLLLEGSPPVIDTWLEDLPACYYVPVLTVAGRGYVGRTHHYAAATEVSDLSVRFQSTLALVRWNWPEDAAEALIAWDEAGEPLDPTAARQQDRVRRNPGDQAGEYRLPLPSAAMLYVRVAMVVRHGGEEFISSGLPVTVRKPMTRLWYDVRPTRGVIGRRMELVLRVEHPTALPALELRGRPDGPPTGPGDGLLLLSVPPGDLKEETAIRFLPDHEPAARFCRLFTAGSHETSTLLILPAGTDA